MRNFGITLGALLATAALLYAAPKLARPAEIRPVPVNPPLVRVWLSGQGGEVSAWIRGQARAYEKKTGTRVYVRTAEQTEDQQKEALAPDLLIASKGSQRIALRGYGLFLRDEGAAKVSPAPTSSLFIRPSPAPRPEATPAPSVDFSRLGPVAAPGALLHALPGTRQSADPLQEFQQGKCGAAILTAGQAEGIPFGVRALPLPEGKGFLPICATAYSPSGEALLRALCQEPAQRALAKQGLYSPWFRLYPDGQSYPGVIESGLAFP